ncbi:MAG TPA: hypothetical protein VFN96_00895 [Gemmatimonadales bacterium]|nr:hypothetical protein [Gemmatimonadales bacterium]
MRPLLLVLGLSALAAGSAPAAGAQAPSFAGTWKLNVKDSDDPAERMRVASEPVKDPAVAGGFTRRRGAVGAGDVNPEGVTEQRRGGARPSTGGGRPGRGCGPVARLQQPPAELVIDQTDSTIVIGSGGQCKGTGTVFFAARVTSEPLPEGGVLQSVHSGLKGGKLEVERRFGDETKVEEAWTLDEKKGRLVAEIRVATPELPRTLRVKLVYDRQP